MTLLRSLVVALIVFAGLEATYLLLIYFGTDQEPSEAYLKLMQFLLATTLAALVCVDNRKHKIFRPTYDMDFIVWLFAPISVPYYLVRSRGLLGVLYAVLVCSLFFMEWIVYALWSATAV